MRSLARRGDENLHRADCPVEIDRAEQEISREGFQSGEALERTVLLAQEENLRRGAASVKHFGEAPQRFMGVCITDDEFRDLVVNSVGQES